LRELIRSRAGALLEHSHANLEDAMV